MQGVDSINGLNFRLRQDEALGPGYYESAAEIEERVKSKKVPSLPNVVFGSANPREKGDFLEASLKQLQFAGAPGHYHHEEQFTKKSHNR